MTTDPLDLTEGVPMTETDPHLWPRPTAASLLAGLHATTDADAAESLTRAIRPTVEVWAVDHPLQPRQYVDTKSEALALVDAWTTVNHAATCWPMRVEVA